MEWRITATKSDEAWFDDHIDQILMAESYRTPPHSQRIGHVECIWREVEPGLVYIAANPNEGSADDRTFAERIVFEQLKPLGFKRAHVKLGASWGVSDAVQQKAIRMVQSGGVHLDRNAQDVVVAHVQGEGTDNDGTPDTHNVEIRRQDPQNPEKVTGAFCDCDWGQFMNTPRTRQWKAFQRIPCSHIVATSWVSMSVPRDEARAPGNDPDQGGQMSLFDMSGGQAPSSMGIMRQRPPTPSAPQGDQMQMAPPPEDVLPQFPMDQQQLPPVNPASVPGGNPGPTPTNPLQYPAGPGGGTFSSFRPTAQQQYQNGQIVDLLQPTQGTQVGRSPMHGAGQPIEIPAGRSGEVLGTDPTTGMVEVLFMDKDFDQNTFFEPFGARVWCWPSEIRRSRQRAPAPNVRRT